MKIPKYWHKTRNDKEGYDLYENIKFLDGFNDFYPIKKMNNDPSWFAYLESNNNLSIVEEEEFNPLYIKLHKIYFKTVYPSNRPERIDQSGVSFVRLDRISSLTIYDTAKIVVYIKDLQNAIGSAYIIANEDQKELVKKIVGENTLEKKHKLSNAFSQYSSIK